MILEQALNQRAVGITGPWPGQVEVLSGEYLNDFQLVECQVGAVFEVNGGVVGLECFGYQQTFSKFFSKLVERYALNAID